MSGPQEPFWVNEPSQGQPPALDYPAEHMPPEYQPTRTPAKRRWPWLACGVVFGVLLLPCLLVTLLTGFGAVLVFQSGASLDAFCTDLTAQRYDAAYDLLSTQLQAQASHERFIQASQQRDETHGQVRRCQSPRNDISLNNTNVTLQFEVVRAQTYKGTVILLHQSRGWRIDRIDPALQLLP